MRMFIEKAMRTHKYIKRTGVPGAYRYWYKMPDGSIQSPDDAQHQGKIDHAKRLLLGKDRGHHNMSTQEIAAHVGLEHDKVQSAKRNLARHGTEWRGRTFSHGYSDEHIAEGHAPTGDGGATQADRESGQASADGTPIGAEARRRARQRRSAGGAPAEAADRRRSTPRPTRTPPAGVAHEVADGSTTLTTRELDSAIQEALHGRQIPITKIVMMNDWAKELVRSGRTPQEAARMAVDRFANPVGTPEGFEQGGRGAYLQRTDSAGRSHQILPSLSGGHSLSIRTTSPRGVDVVHESHHPTAEAAAAESRRQESNRSRVPEAFPEETAPATSAPAAPAKPRMSAAEGRRRAAQSIREMQNQAAAEDAGQDAGGMTAAQRHAKLRELGIHLGGESSSPAESSSDTRARASAAAARVRESAIASSPAAPHAAEIHEAVPSLAAADQPISRMEEAAARGENPYISRASEVFHNIVGDLKPERKQVCQHVFQAIQALKDSGSPLNEANLIGRYNEISGKRIRSLSGIGAEFEKGTFMSIQEILENRPVDPEVERMKRGYGAMQFARMKPYLKESWKQANPSAPPPMPTFGDIKSWTEHGGVKPEWAGNTRLAMPKEVFDANHKSPDGKVKYPPQWMPIHMMPTWIYAAKLMEKEGGASVWASSGGGMTPAYAADKTPTRDQASSTGWKVDMGNQARSGQEFRERGPEGMIVNAMRKYIQMRGGAHQLTDIPSHKLSEVGLTHSDIFKSNGELSDKDIKKLVSRKIVDPVALVPFLKKEIKKNVVKKSFSLVIDSEMMPINFKKSFTIDIYTEQQRRDELIKGIRRLRAVRAARG